MPNPSYHRLQQSLTQFASVIAVVVALSLPLGYGSAVYRDFTDSLDFKGQMKVMAVEALIVARPETWMLTDKRIHDALERRPELERFEHLRVLDLERMLVAEAGETPLTPVAQRSFELHDADRVTGYLEFEVSLRPTLVRIGFSGLIGIGLGFLVFMTLRILPLRVLRRVMDALHTEKERAETTLGAIGDAVVTTDAEGRIEYLNPTAQRLFGIDMAAARGRRLDEVVRLFDAQNDAPLEAALSKALSEKRSASCQGRSEVYRADQTRLAVEERAAPIFDADGRLTGGVMVLRDVSLSREIDQRRSWEETHDPLTEIFNRREFENRVRLALAELQANGQEHVVCYMDLDGFKVVNDTCGHAVGDRLLVQLAQLIRSRIRESDTMARLGGDEFGALLVGCDLERARIIAGELIAAVDEYVFVSDGKRFSVGISIGLTRISADHAGITEIIGEADCACYWAKAQGRNRVCVYQASDMKLAARRSETGWVPQINAAFEEGRFQLYYQDYLPLRSDRNDPERRHLEVLLRMIGRGGEIIPPGRFLPAAERFNLINAIDRWVVSTLFAAYPRLKAEHGGAPLTCCINLSGASLNTPDFIGFVRQQAELNRLEPGAICFELTETIAVHDIQVAAEFVLACKAIGIRFALDDFGTGSSSFGYLRHLPVDYLKIDGGFVKDIEDDSVDLAMVETINRIGHILGMRTIAECAENEAIIERLREIGVDYAQGYGVSMPAPLLAPGGMHLLSRDDEERRR